PRAPSPHQVDLMSVESPHREVGAPRACRELQWLRRAAEIVRPDTATVTSPNDQRQTMTIRRDTRMACKREIVRDGFDRFPIRGKKRNAIEQRLSIAFAFVGEGPVLREQTAVGYGVDDDRRAGNLVALQIEFGGREPFRLRV